MRRASSSSACCALPTFRGASFRAWLFSIAHNTITDTYRRQGTHARVASAYLAEAGGLSDPAPVPEQLALLADEQRLLATALAFLPGEQRQVIELWLSGIPSVEVAHILGLSPERGRNLSGHLHTRRGARGERGRAELR
ncbi:MAG: sigma-70 family RNA polymerase sigma factor [Thermomicrobiales bacterium]